MSKKTISEKLHIILILLCAILIPAFLIVYSIQSRRYEILEQEVAELEKKQVELIEENKTLITNISILSNSNRIEKIAEEQLGMHKADSGEIVRVEMKESR